MHDSGTIELAVSHPSRRVRFGPLRRILSDVAEAEGVPIEALSVVLTDHPTVLKLNRDHLDRTYTTDVIAFDLRTSNEVRSVDGEIYIDLDTAAERAPEFGVRYTDEVHRYAVHGLLHLIGYRDDSASASREMKRLEDKYLRVFGSS